MEYQHVMDTTQFQHQHEGKQLTQTQYAKLADWGERVGLIVFGSLVVQQLITRTSVPVIGLGIIMTVAAYVFAYRALKRST